MSKHRIIVTQVVEVEVDDSKFDDTFLAEFRQSFYSFNTIEQHAEHIAQLQARGIIDLEHFAEFIEGYGPSDAMGVKARVISIDTDRAGAAT